MYKPRDGRGILLGLNRVILSFELEGAALIVIGRAMAILDVPTSRFKTCKSL